MHFFFKTVLFINIIQHDHYKLVCVCGVWGRVRQGDSSWGGGSTQDWTGSQWQSAGSEGDWSVSDSDWSVSNSDWSVSYSDWKSTSSDDWSGSDSGFLVDGGVESVDWVSGVVYDSPGTVGFEEGVASLDDISLSGFGLALGVSGQGVADGVAEVVGWVGVVFVISGGGSHRGDWSVVGDYWSSGDRPGHGECRPQQLGVGGGDESEKSDNLKRSTK